MAKTTIYYDGGCPLCRAEISHYARKDRYGALHMVDVADSATPLPEGTDRATLLRRFHVVTSDDGLVSGAAAFVAIWRVLPGWRRLAGLARVPGVTLALEGAYRLFLPLRPLLVRAFVALFGARHAP